MDEKNNSNEDYITEDSQDDVESYLNQIKEESTTYTIKDYIEDPEEEKDKQYYPVII